MRTKTLLIATAAALAAGVISSEAQVYSQNVVGYYNIPVASQKFNLVANQLNLDNTNSINSIFTGLASDPNGNTNTVIWLWNTGTAQYGSFQYFTGADADNYFLASGSKNGFYDTGGNLQNKTLPIGQAAFLQNKAPATITVTMVGNVAQGTNIQNFVQGYTLVGSPIPVSTNLVSPVINYTGTSDPNGVNNDVIWLWNPVTSQYGSFQYFKGADADNYFLASGSVTGFYDTGGNLQNISPNVGTGFFIQHKVAPVNTWTNIFQVQ
jgi:hypothetical protein